jgi:predicted GNAT superfamily acetyltransferase
MTLEMRKDLDTIHVVTGKRYLFAVEMSHNKEDYLKYEDLRQEIWRESTDKMAGARNMLCENYFDRGSSLYTGVFVEDDKGGFPRDEKYLVGFSYGFVGVRDKDLGFRSPENLCFYSQYLGVKKGFQSLGLGVLIKEFQRKAVFEVFGVNTITCTYDPLVGVNAYRNIHRFGMKVIEYKEAFYQDLGGELNRIDIPSDRLFVSWDLTKETKIPRYDLKSLVRSGHLAIHTRLATAQCSSGPVELEVVSDIRPIRDRDFVLLEIPFDFYRMLRETDVPDQHVRKIPLEWRYATREIFQKLFARQYRVIDFSTYRGKDRKKNFYVLKK